MTRALQHLALLVVVLACALWGLGGRALASDTEASMLVDDTRLIYSSAGAATATLHQLHNLGVDEVKVSLVWQLVAPDAESKQAPKHFNAADPGDYPSGAWGRYDRIVREAHSLGMAVDFQFVGPAPEWAWEPGRAQGPVLGHMPVPTDFVRFAQAAGRRYGGHDDGLPRVTHWELWNEPNEHAWLNPWYRRSHGRTILLQPSEYRSLVDAGWLGLARSGHRADTILVGETANVGTIEPLPFIRDVYCVNGQDIPLSGAAATAVGCARQSRAAFVAAHPGLFRSAGFAHHPYAFSTPPDRPPPRNYVSMQNLSTLEGMLNAIFRAYGVARASGVPLYLTEWGFESNPPDPYVPISAAEQATYLDEGAYMSYADPYVAALAQFELVDYAPRPDTTPGSRLYWSTFQTGLEYPNGSPKPSYAAFMLPLWVPSPQHGASVAVWGQLRPADHNRLQYGVLQYAAAGSSDFSTLAEVVSINPEGFFLTHVALLSAGTLRLAWLSPSGRVEYSRNVPIS